jgi:hypothetical protein
MHVGRRVSRMQATRGRHGPALLVPVSAVTVTVRDGVGEYVAARVLGAECRKAGPGEVGWAGDAMRGVDW